MTSAKGITHDAPSHFSEWVAGILILAVSALGAWLGSFPVMRMAEAHASIYRQLEVGMPQEETLQMADALGQRRQEMPPDADPGQPVPDIHSYPFYRPLYGGRLRLGFIDDELVSKEVWTPDGITSDEQILNPRYGGSLFGFDFLFFAVPLASLALGAGAFHKAWPLGTLKRWGIAAGGLVCWLVLVLPFSPLCGLASYYFGKHGT